MTVARLLGLGCSLLTLTCTGTGTGLAMAQEGGPHQVAVIDDARIPESSALARSTEQSGLVFTINDSGHQPVVYAVAIASGRVVGTTALAGVTATDTEALSIGADGRLYVADIGDNDSSRRAVTVYALPQPGRSDAVIAPVTYTVRYTDGPHDAEALVADPVTGRLAILTKGLFAGSVYRLPQHLSTDRPNVARPMTGVRIPGLVTDAAWLSDGSAVVARTYTEATVYRMPGWHRVTSISLPRQRQGESLAVDATGSTLLVGTEGLPSPLVEVPLPPAVSKHVALSPGGVDDQPAATPTGTAEPPAAVAGDGDWRVWGVGASTVVLGGAWLAVRRSQRNRSTT